MWLFYLIFFSSLLSFFHLFIRGAGAHAARASAGDETKDPADLMGEKEENWAQLKILEIPEMNSSSVLPFPGEKMCTSSEKGCVQSGGTRASPSDTDSVFFHTFI